MEVVTTTAGAAATNNHNHSHFHHNDQQRMPPHHTHNGISVGLICTNGNGSAGDGDGGERSPFQREVREWQRIDPDTGALLTGRLEADRWINGPMNKYGKISDSQNITQPNGTQHTQRKQLEVLQARTATGGAMQVIRTQTVQKTSSRWSSSTSNSTTASASSPSSVMASPTITGALTMNGKVNSFSNNAHKSSSHSNRLHSRFNQPKSSSLEITEVSSHSHSSSSRCSSDVDDAFDNDDDDDDITENGLINGSNHFSNRHSFPYNSKNKIDSSNISLLLETAPSLKLSNLMKSNSSLSSNGNSSSSSNSTTASTISNLNNKKSAVGKISLHSIVGDVENTNRRTTTVTSASTSFPSSSSTLSSLSSPSTSSLTTMAATSATNWQQHSSRRFEQPTLYGKDSQCQSLTKSRVGVNVAEAGAGNGYGDAVSDVGDGGGGGGVVDNLTPTQLKSRQQRQDLESFRHCTEQLRTSTSTSASASASSLAPTTTSPFFADCANDDDEVLCLNKTHQIRQHNPCSSETATQLQRSRSISIDDLSTEWEKNSEKNNEESGEWRRVSKLRRSFQSSTNSKVDNSTQQRKPIDLPSNSVSVARIRAELENGRRLNTAMRNNHIDLAALDTILNGSTMESRDLKSIPTQRSNFLTAESLKEIRAGLKKLSDESLYRDDFAPSISNATAPDEHIEIQDVKKPPERVRLHQLSPKKPTEITPPKSAFQVFTRTVTPPNGSPTTNGSSFATQYSLPNGCVQKPNTRSLESRQKNRESTASIDWHLRRKSYGFEKMTPPDDKSMFRMDASTDSGLGRSGEQLGNWSPTESGNSSNLKTVIHFGETPKVVANTTTPKVLKRYNAPTQTTESIDSDLKRHSIAVDESQYVRDNVRKTSQVHLPGYYDSSIEAAPSSLQPVRSAVQQKRVEFCKTEVHFAAESGRVNIVETDGKPPPTNNFRRRRRTTSGPMQTLMTTSDSAINKTDNVTLFGEDNQTKILASSTVAYKASLVDSPSENVLAATSVTCSIPKAIGNVSTRSSSSTTTTTNRYASTNVVVDSADGGDGMDEISAIRGILKNKPIKPKPYHLGENIDSADALWGVQLKPVCGIVKNELTKSTSPPSIAASSVAERIRIVEKRQENPSVTQTNGYSTKINLSLGDEPRIWTDAGMTLLNDINININGGGNTTYRRTSLQEIMLHDLREHQRILDEGLKSTSLIIRTMRSANEFDEAMRRLSIASVESTIIPPIVIPTPMMRSHSYQESIRRTSIATCEENCDKNSIKLAQKTSSTLITVRRSSNDMPSDILKSLPVPTPRLKVLSNADKSVSQQLTQLRRMYEMASAPSTSQDEDSADEEVKRYFKENYQNESTDSGGGTQDSFSSPLDDENFIENTNSWSRLKAKRTIWRIGFDENSKQTFTGEELPKTNVMNIELHSPQMSLERNSAAKIKQTIPPVAKPRTVLSANVVEIPTNNNVKTPDNNRTEKRDSTNRDILKIVKETRGARKLREHELSYFGVQVPKDSDDNKETRPKSSYPNIQTKSPKRTLPQRKTNDNQHAEMIQETTKPSIKTNWQLLNDDKPDLLRHSSIAVEPKPATRTAEVKPMERQSLKNLSDDDDYDEHIYENIVTDMKPVFKVQSPTRMSKAKDYDEQRESYNRKTDLKRDAFILSEMTENADETLKAISDEAAIKDQRRRSLQRRRTKPLETIDEKTIAEKINDKCIAVKVTRSTLASEAKRNARYISSSPTKLSSRARSSSISSNEGCSCARSRSLSSEREYENIRIRPKRISKSATRAKDTRSSSQDSHRALKTNYCSSGDDDVHARTVKLIPRSDVRKHSSKQDALRQRDKVQRSSKEKSQRHSDEHKKRTSSSTAHSSRKERVECNDEDKKRHHRNHHHHLNSTDSSSARKAKDPKSYSSSRNIPIDKKEKERSHSSSTRAVEHTYSSGRSERDSGRDKTARSKAYFSRSKNERISSTSHASHEKHRTATPTNLSENKKSTTISKQHDAKHREPSMSTTNGKTTPLINDHQQEHHQHHQHHATLQNGNHENHHLHSMTTATIAAKHRENRSGKDRK